MIAVAVVVGCGVAIVLMQRGLDAVRRRQLERRTAVPAPRSHVRTFTPQAQLYDHQKEAS